MRLFGLTCSRRREQKPATTAAIPPTPATTLPPDDSSDDEPAAVDDEVIAPKKLCGPQLQARKDLQLLSIEAPMKIGLKILGNKWCFTCSAKMLRKHATDEMSTRDAGALVLGAMPVLWYYNLARPAARRLAWLEALEALEAGGLSVKVRFTWGQESPPQTCSGKAMLKHIAGTTTIFFFAPGTIFFFAPPC
jgi:hypothetical protein